MRSYFDTDDRTRFIENDAGLDLYAMNDARLGTACEAIEQRCQLNAWIRIMGEITKT